MKIRTRIILAYLVIVALGFYYFVRKLNENVKPRYMESVEAPMVDTAEVLAALLAADLSDTGGIDPGRLRDAFDLLAKRKFRAQIYSFTKTGVDLRVYVTDARGMVLFDSDGGKAEGQDYSQRNDVYLTLRGHYGARSTRDHPDDPTSAVLYVAAPVLLPDGAIAGVLSVSKPQKSMAQFMADNRRKIVWLGATAAFVVVVVGALLSAWLTWPINRLTHYARAVQSGQRVPLPKLGSPEIAELGRAFEEMRDALEGKRYVEQYVQTLTHEIKSPVAAIRGAAELLHEEMPAAQRGKFLENIRVETVRIQEVIDRLLLLSAVEARKALEEPIPIDLGHVLASAGESIGPQLAAKAVELRSNVPQKPCVTRGDAFLLEKAVLNLLQNAVDFSPRGGVIAVSLHRADGQWKLSVEDNGPGVPDYARERVFERFFSLPRPDTGKKSSGLGLALVREVALLHRGAVELKNRENGGAVATLALPADERTA